VARLCGYSHWRLEIHLRLGGLLVEGEDWVSGMGWGEIGVGDGREDEHG
jgi:hypothetical protein